MKKLVFTLVFLSFLIFGGTVFAESNTSAFASTKVTIQDLGVENPGILPTNPFYFLKVWNRSFQRRITRDPLKKVAYELDVTNQQAAEIKQLLTYSQNTYAIKAAVDRYTENVAQLKARLEEVKDTSENPNVDKFLGQLTDLSLKHQGLMNDIEEKFSTSTDLQNSLENAKDAVGEVLVQIPERFESAERFEKRLFGTVVSQGSYARVENALQVLEQIESRLPEDAQKKIGEVRARLEQKIEQSIEQDMQRVTPLLKELEVPGAPSTVTPPKAGESGKTVPVLKILPIEDEKLEQVRPSGNTPILKALNSQP